MTSTYVGPGEGIHYPMIDGDHVAKTVVRHGHGGFEVFEVHAVAGPPGPPHVSPGPGSCTCWTAP